MFSFINLKWRFRNSKTCQVNHIHSAGIREMEREIKKNFFSMHCDPAAKVFVLRN